MLGSLLAGVGLPLLVKVAGSALGLIDSPLAKTAQAALGEVSTAIDAGSIKPEQVAEADRHIERMAELESTERTAALREINESLRREVASDDAYVRRMRPTFGYIIAATWGMLMGAVAYTVVADPGHAGSVVEAVGSLSAIWTVGLSVLGIYVYKRSDEKRAGNVVSTSPIAGIASLAASIVKGGSQSAARNIAK